MNYKMKLFVKDVSNRSEAAVRNEVMLQKKAYSLGLCPQIIETDYKTFIKMTHLEEMCIADMYGERIEDVPVDILTQIYNIVTRLYLECDIEYVDITPYNFIERDGKVTIIDFGDAQIRGKKNWFLMKLFKNKRLQEWNPDFR